MGEVSQKSKYSTGTRAAAPWWLQGWAGQRPPPHSRGLRDTFGVEKTSKSIESKQFSAQQLILGPAGTFWDIWFSGTFQWSFEGLGSVYFGVEPRKIFVGMGGS